MNHKKSGVRVWTGFNFFRLGTSDDRLLWIQ